MMLEATTATVNRCPVGTIALMFRNPQVVLFSRDVAQLATFYIDLGFQEMFRVPADGDPIHVDVELDGYRIGIASVESPGTITGCNRSAKVSARR